MMVDDVQNLQKLLLLTLWLTGYASQAVAADAASAAQKFSSVDTLWVLLGAALVIFMQPGFAMCETGLTRAKTPATSS